MSKLQYLDDTIAAISTAAGLGGIGIVRLSGREALSIADQIFKGKGIPSRFKSHCVHFGYIIDPKEHTVIDEVLLTVMRAPRTYTKEDIVEINCHGGPIVLKLILSLVMQGGARLAEPGEFTKRAFLNGRIDLAQAEAVLDIIEAKTDAFARISTNQLKGDLTKELESIREIFMNAYTRMEAVVNFPEDDIDDKGKENLRHNLTEARERIEVLLKSSRQGMILRQGVKIVLCGCPNVGKSSLLNVLLKTPRAIVSEIAGTTRDTIEEAAQIGDIPVSIVDTAGILTPRNGIEEEAVKRSRQHTQRADIVLFILDGSAGITAEDYVFMKEVKNPNVIFVVNKSDLKSAWDSLKLKSLYPGRAIIKVSALTREGMEDLEEKIVEHILQGQNIEPQNILVNNLRHIQSLHLALDCASKAVDDLNQALSLEFVSDEVTVAINHLDTITGREIQADLLDKIFSEFCIGK